jgi:glycerophosphoryl diester phosphodiesterase
VLRPHPYLAGEGPVLLAHRGGSTEAVENSLSAFEHVRDLGITYVETDAHATVDGVVVLHHDEDLGRMTGVAARIADLPWAELSRIPDHSGHPPVRLETALEAFPGLRFNIDAKAEAVVGPLVRIARRHVDRVGLASFSDELLARIRAAASEVSTSTGERETAALVALSRLPLRQAARLARARLSAATAATCLQVPLRHRGIPVVTPRLLALAHELGLEVHVWTVDQPGAMDHLLDLGVDGLVTDVPSTALRVLAARGAWR